MSAGMAILKFQANLDALDPQGDDVAWNLNSGLLELAHSIQNLENYVLLLTSELEEIKGQLGQG